MSENSDGGPAGTLKGNSPADLAGPRPGLLWVNPGPGHQPAKATVVTLPVFLECQHWNTVAVNVMHCAPGMAPLGLPPQHLIFLN